MLTPESVDGAAPAALMLITNDFAIVFQYRMGMVAGLSLAEEFLVLSS
jgi:hypothetical protein